MRKNLYVATRIDNTIYGVFEKISQLHERLIEDGVDPSYILVRLANVEISLKGQTLYYVHEDDGSGEQYLPQAIVITREDAQAYIDENQNEYSHLKIRAIMIGED